MERLPLHCDASGQSWYSVRADMVGRMQFLPSEAVSAIIQSKSRLGLLQNMLPDTPNCIFSLRPSVAVAEGGVLGLSVRCFGKPRNYPT